MEKGQGSKALKKNWENLLQTRDEADQKDAWFKKRFFHKRKEGGVASIKKTKLIVGGVTEEICRNDVWEMGSILLKEQMNWMEQL